MRNRPLRRGPIGPPRVRLPTPNRMGGNMPSIRPPKGIAEQLNRAKLKDFKQLGSFLLFRRRRLQA